MIVFFYLFSNIFLGTMVKFIGSGYALNSLKNPINSITIAYYIIINIMTISGIIAAVRRSTSGYALGMWGTLMFLFVCLPLLAEGGSMFEKTNSFLL